MSSRRPTATQNASQRNDLRLHYYPETDSLYVELNSKPGVDSREIDGGRVLDFDAEGNVVGIDIDHAS
jgi:uncharacterized protein YuzE